ncbi:STAS domain-containing protein [Dechloromonas sp. A34]|uniref:STAS domain-containing protein n=1 Tax=Dechloromonas sp. A34 TaxID=447588 RepID=UPI0022496DE6|nr:STAS domain-containing protein [Dechloromonas sp. A34]
MTLTPAAPAAIFRTTPQELALSGSWTARGIGQLVTEFDALSAPSGTSWVIDASGIEAFDTAGAWVVQKLLHRLRDDSANVELRQLRPEFARLLDVLGREVAPRPLRARRLPPAPHPGSPAWAAARLPPSNKVAPCSPSSANARSPLAAGWPARR